MKCNWRDKQPHGCSRPIIFWSYLGLQQADLRPIIFWSYLGLQQADLKPIICRSHFDLLSGHSKPILGRSYSDHISVYSRPMICRTIPILFRVTAGRSYFRTRRNACVTAGKTTMTAGKICHGCFETLSWPHRTPANIINTCFWLLETCTKCSYFLEENIRPSAQRLAFEVWVYRTPATNIPWAGVLRQVSRQAAIEVLMKSQRFSNALAYVWNCRSFASVFISLPVSSCLQLHDWKCMLDMKSIW